MRFQKVTIIDGVKKITFNEDSITFDHSITPLVRVAIKVDIRAADSLANPREPVTDELERQEARTLRRRRRSMLKSQEKAKKALLKGQKFQARAVKAKVKAARLAKNYEQTVASGME